MWYVESYAKDGQSAEGTEYYYTYEDAYVAVKKIRLAGERLDS